MQKNIKLYTVYEFKFRRQHDFDPYVLDFFCHEAALAIELDGFAHDLGSNPQCDISRDQFLADRGFKTLRFRALEVRDNLDGIVAKIIDECRARMPNSPPLDFEGRWQAKPDGGAS